MSDHLYPWIRELLSPGASVGALDRGASDVFRVLRLFLGTSVGSSGSEVDLGVRDWGHPFEEVRA
jgi:hypothetical protein